MADSYQTIALNETRDIIGPALTPSVIASAATTAAISSGTATLFDTFGAVAGGINASAITGSTVGQSSAPQGWFEIVKPQILGLGVGLYTLVLTLTVTAAGVTRTIEQRIGLKVTKDYL